MSLTKRQAAAINQIIREEIQSVLKGRKGCKGRAGLLRYGEFQERLVEAGPDAMRVSASVMDEQFKEAANDAGTEIADDLIYKFRQKILGFVAGQLNKHTRYADEVDPHTFAKEVEEFDPDSIADVSQECVSDITAAFEKYAKALGQLALNIADPEEDEEGE